MLNRLRLAKRNFGLIGTAGLAISGLVISVLNWRGAYLTISQHIALDMTSMIVFGVVSTIATTLVAVCLLDYIARRWKLGRAFKCLAGMLTAGLYLIGWFPEQANNAASSLIHNAAALMVFAVAATMVMTLGALLWDRTGWALKISGAVFVAVGLFGVITSSFFFEVFKDNIFWIEGSYLITFYAFILSMVYSKDVSRGAWFKKHFHNLEKGLTKLIHK